MSGSPDAIAIIVPVLGRPHRVAELMASVAASTTVPHRLLFVVSPDDVAEIDELRRRCADFVVMDQPPGTGDYARKINLGYRSTTEPFVFTGADDLHFHTGWDTAALAAFGPGIGVVGTDDLGNPRVKRGDHSTHSLVARWYADQLGTIDGAGAIYVECYPHEFVDDEFVETAKSRGAFAFAHGSRVEHLHPNWHKAPMDDLHRASPQRMRQGAIIYRSRRKRWGGREPKPTAPIAAIVATFGDDSWRALADRAAASVTGQNTAPAELIVHHGAGLAEARNEAARRATAPWLLFIDADDELEAKFLSAMKRVMARKPKAGLLNPAVRFVMPDGRRKPSRLFRPVDLSKGNYLVIGTAVRSDLFWQAGGFDPRWEAWEDWALWRRVVALGGEIAQVPNAVYRANWRQDGRNNVIEDTVDLRRRIDQDFAEWKRRR